MSHADPQKLRYTAKGFDPRYREELEIYHGFLMDCIGSDHFGEFVNLLEQFPLLTYTESAKKYAYVTVAEARNIGAIDGDVRTIRELAQQIKSFGRTYDRLEEIKMAFALGMTLLD